MGSSGLNFHLDLSGTFDKLVDCLSRFMGMIQQLAGRRSIDCVL